MRFDPVFLRDYVKDRPYTDKPLTNKYIREIMTCFDQHVQKSGRKFAKIRESVF